MQCGAIFYAAVANYCWRFVGIGRCLIAVGITSAPSGSSVPAHVVAKRRLGDRKEDVTIESPVVGARIKVRLLLPSHYETDKVRRWPLLYLLHGCCDSYVSWTRSTDIEQLTKGRTS
jgi:diacylglycerol O-acyltransferase/trehalose O-mycolyltransferase